MPINGISTFIQTSLPSFGLALINISEWHSSWMNEDALMSWLHCSRHTHIYHSVCWVLHCQALHWQATQAPTSLMTLVSMMSMPTEREVFHHFHNCSCLTIAGVILSRSSETQVKLNCVATNTKQGFSSSCSLKKIPQWEKETHHTSSHLRASIKPKDTDQMNGNHQKSWL